MPLYISLLWIVPFHHRQRNLLPGKIPEQPPNNPAPIHRLGNQHPHTLIQPNRSLIKRLMMNRTQCQSVLDLTRSAKLLPLDMRGFKSNRGVIMPHVKPADCALIVISTQHLLAEQRIANLTDLLNIKTHLIRDLFLNAFGKMRFKDLLRQRAYQVFVLIQQRKVFFIKPACDVMFHKFFNGRLLTASGQTKLSILQIPKAVPFEPPEGHIWVMRLPLWAKAF